MSICVFVMSVIFLLFAYAFAWSLNFSPINMGFESPTSSDALSRFITMFMPIVLFQSLIQTPLGGAFLVALLSQIFSRSPVLPSKTVFSCSILYPSFFRYFIAKLMSSL